jgi:hypothetical protein
MGVTEGEGEGVRLVFGRLFCERKKEAHHVLDLGLLRPTCSDYGELDGFGAVLVDLHISLEPGAEHRTAGLAELQGGVHVTGEDELLYRHFVRPVFLHDLSDAVEDHAQPSRPRKVVNANTAAGDADAAPTIRVDHTEAGSAGARVDAQDAVAGLGFGLHWFRRVNGRRLEGMPGKTINIRHSRVN